MKILFVTEYFPPEPNAAASRVFERARLWVAEGHAVTVITGVPNFPQGRVHAGYRNRWQQEEKLNGIRIIRVKTYIHPNRGRFRRILDQFSLLPVAVLAGLRTNRPDVVVATSPTLFAALAASLVGRLRKLPFVLEIGDLGAASMDATGIFRNRGLLGIVHLFERFIYAHARRIVVQTNSMRDVLVNEGLTERKCAVISNGIDVAVFREVEAQRRTRRPSDRFVVGYVGTLGMSHGLEHTIDAARLVSDAPILFRFVGDGAARPELERLATRAKLDNVTFEGPWPRSQMPFVWSGIDLALVSLRDHATFRTVLPSKILEASACGVPILFTGPLGEAADFVRKHEIGTVVRAESSEDVAQAVERLASVPELLAEQSRRALSLAPIFDRSVQAERFMAVLNDVVREQELGA